jgi:predicted metalloendopeptidase
MAKLGRRNYGAIGRVIGHAITNRFDHQGLQVCGNYTAGDVLA